MIKFGGAGKHVLLRLQSSLSSRMEPQSYWCNGRAVGIATVTWAVALELARTVAAAAAGCFPEVPGELQGGLEWAVPPSRTSLTLFRTGAWEACKGQPPAPGVVGTPQADHRSLR